MLCSVANEFAVTITLILVLWLHLEIPIQIGLSGVSKQTEGKRQSSNYKMFTSQGDVPVEGNKRDSAILVLK